jgi:hypothetical protein
MIKVRPILDVVPRVNEHGVLIYEAKLNGLGAIDPSGIISVIGNLFKSHNSKLSVHQFFKERDNVLDSLRQNGIPQDCIDKVLAEDCMTHACVKTNYLKDYRDDFNSFAQKTVQKIVACAVLKGAVSQEFYNTFIQTGSVSLANEKQQQTTTPSSSALGPIDLKTGLIIGGGLIGLATLVYLITR